MLKISVPKNIKEINASDAVQPIKEASIHIGLIYDITHKIKDLFHCKHKYRPVFLVKTVSDGYGNAKYTYRMQCIKCGTYSRFYQTFSKKQDTLPYKSQEFLKNLQKGDLLDITTWDGPNCCIWFCKRENGKIFGLAKESREVVVVDEHNIAALVQNDHFSTYMKHSYEIVNSKEFKSLLETEK